MSEYSFSNQEIKFGLAAEWSKICADRMRGKGWRLCSQLVAKGYNGAEIRPLIGVICGYNFLLILDIKDRSMVSKYLLYPALGEDKNRN
jgi:hypothetical protein